MECGAHTNPDGRPAASRTSQIADSEAPGELGSSDLQLPSQPLRITMEECGEF